MFILGISAYYHDAAAALIHDGEIMAAAQEERFTRLKNDKSFPENAILYCLTEGGITIDDLEAVVFYEKPFEKFDRILQTFYEIAPRGISFFVKAMPVWIKEKLLIKKEIKTRLFRIQPFNKKALNILFSEHHLSHAASTYYPSRYSESAILTVDGVGEWATCTISHGIDNKISILKQINFPHSLGLLYAAFTYYCGFTVNQDEYKLMGLAAYGNVQDEECKRFCSLIENELIHINQDGSIGLKQKYFDYTAGSRMIKEIKWNKLFETKRRIPDEPITQVFCNLALAIQLTTEKVMMLLAEECKRITHSNNLCLAGGVALNCVANGKIVAAGLFDNIFIQPASGDAGGAIGAALSCYHLAFNRPLIAEKYGKDLMKGAFLGPAFSDIEIQATAIKFKLNQVNFGESTFYEKIIDLIVDGKVIGWFQGRAELAEGSRE